MRAWFLILAAALVAAPAPAQDIWYDQDGPAAPHPSLASRDGFGVMLLLTPDREGFLRAWAGPTPPQLPTTSGAARNERVFAAIIFRGCRAGTDGNCNVTADFAIRRPDGTPYGETMHGPIWDRAPAPGSNLLLGMTMAGLEVEPQDPLGDYLIRAIVTDHVAGISLEVEQPLTVGPAPAASPSA